MKRHKGCFHVIGLMVVVFLFYPSMVTVLPALEKETLPPQSALVNRVARLDVQASMLLSDVFRRIPESVDLDVLWHLIQEAKGLHTSIPLYKEHERIVIIAEGCDIEFSLMPSEDGYRIPNSNIWVKINHHFFPSGLRGEQREYVAKRQGQFNNLLNRLAMRFGHESVTEIRYLDLDTVVKMTDDGKDKLVGDLVAYVNSGTGKALILLGNYFDMKGVYSSMAGRGVNELKLRNIYGLYRFTSAPGPQGSKQYMPAKKLLCYEPTNKHAPLMPLYQFVYRRALEHKYTDGNVISTVSIVIEEFSPFFERDVRRIEDMEIGAWKSNGVAMRREKIKERHYRNPVYIIREGDLIAGGIATSCLQIGGEYKRNIPRKYKLLIGAHDPKGDTIFDFSVFTDLNPEIKVKRYGDILALCTLDVAKLCGKKEVIAASRCEGLTMFLMKAHRIGFRDAIARLSNILDRLRAERGLDENYRFMVDDVLPYILGLYPGQVPVGFDLQKYIWEYLSEDPFLNAFHHRLGSKDVLVVPNSRTGDIRGFGAQVYTSYYEKFQTITADPRDREGLLDQIYGAYYGKLESPHSKMMGSGISPEEVPAELLIQVSREELETAIASLEARYERIKKDSRFNSSIDDIRKYINGIRGLLEQGKIFRFEAIVNGPEEFLLGFADRRGIALCNWFFQRESDLNTVLDEALFHEAYHLYHLNKEVDQRDVHYNARRLQEMFFDDGVHYELGADPGQRKSRLGRYARVFISERAIKPAGPRFFPARVRRDYCIVRKILRGDRNLVILNNLGILGVLVGAESPFRLSTRFNSLEDASLFIKSGRWEEFLSVVIGYYKLFADRLLEGISIDGVSEDDIVRALLEKLKRNLGLKLTKAEDRFLIDYMKSRKGEVKTERDITGDIGELRERVEAKTIERIQDNLGNKPGLLYFDIDKILEESPETASRYLDLLEGLSIIENYTVVYVNSDPGRSMNQILGKHDVLAPRLSRIMRKGIVLDARGMRFNNVSERGKELVEKAVELAKEKLGVASIPPGNITLAIYTPNDWLYPGEFLKQFSVIIMTSKSIRLEEAQLARLEELFPGIKRLITENKELLLAEELHGLSDELETLEGTLVDSQA